MAITQAVITKPTLLLWRNGVTRKTDRVTLEILLPPFGRAGEGRSYGKKKIKLLVRAGFQLAAPLP